MDTVYNNETKPSDGRRGGDSILLYNTDRITQENLPGEIYAISSCRYTAVPTVSVIPGSKVLAASLAPAVK